MSSPTGIDFPPVGVFTNRNSKEDDVIGEDKVVGEDEVVGEDTNHGDTNHWKEKRKLML